MFDYYRTSPLISTSWLRPVPSLLLLQCQIFCWVIKSEFLPNNDWVNTLSLIMIKVNTNKLFKADNNEINLVWHGKTRKLFWFVRFVRCEHLPVLTTEAGIWVHKDGTCWLSFKLMRAAVKCKTLTLVLAAEITFAGHEMDFFLGLNKSHIRLIDIQWVVTLINYNLKCHKMQIIQSALLPAQSSTAFYLHQMIPNGLRGHTSPYPYLSGCVLWEVTQSV